MIGAVLVVGAKAPKLISDELVAKMRDGSVLVDISVDQGGCFESTRPTTHPNPTFEVNGSIFYCVANMPGAVPHSSTHALVNATLPYVLDIANHGWKDAVSADPALAEGVNVVEGSIVYQPVAEAHGLDSDPLSKFVGLTGRAGRCPSMESPRSAEVALATASTPGPAAPTAMWPGTHAGGETGSGHRVEPDGAQRHLARPYGEGEVGLVVVRRAVAHLDRSLVEGQRGARWWRPAP